MTRFRYLGGVRLGLVMLLLLAASLACSLGSGDGDNKTDSESVPTVEASITPPATRTPIPSFTPFRTSTPTTGFAPLPTATRIAFFPTWTPYQQPPTQYPYDVRISYPVDGSQIAGFVTIVGSASHPRFLQYALEWGPHPNPSNLWYPMTGPQRRTVINGGLAAWDTRTVNDGTYQLRLHVWLTDGTETYALVSAIRVSNQAPTVAPTQTPTPRPNNIPKISPIAGQVVDAGQTINIQVTTSDPDGDAVNLFIASSNPSIASPQVTAANQIAVSGVTAGTATITVTANDNRGGLASTAFLVTVRGQNRAPTLSPLLSQDIDVGAPVDLAIAASDPDGDTLTVTAASNDAAVVTASALNVSTIRLTGVAAGTANVTVTASDGKGGVVNTAFQVNVGAVNRAPTIDSVPRAQNLTVGDGPSVNFVASDPDGDPVTATAASDTPAVVTASVTAPGVIRLDAVGEGTATVTITVTDGQTPTIGTFAVTVTAGNQPPTIDALAPQTMSVGETRDLAYTANDSDGDTLNATASSDNGGVVTASVTAPGTLNLAAQGAGTATVTLSVDDGNHPAVETTFTVSVAEVNVPPTIDAIAGVTLAAGETRDVGYTATDPDGDTLNAVANSDDQNVVVASVSAPGVITLDAQASGSATVTLTVDDGNNPAVTMPFTVTVVSNAPPSVGAIAAQTMTTGETKDVAYTATDPDGDTLNAVASSDNSGVVTASVSAPGTISLAAQGAGTATVTLTVDDGNNPGVAMPFTVTVADVNVPPVVNAINPQTMAVGETRDVFYTANDSDGDVLAGAASSDDSGVVTAAVNVQGVIALSAVGAGTANVTLSVNDGVNPDVTTSFAVTVEDVNSPPTIDPLNAQVMAVGETRDVGYVATDFDGDQLTASASSDNPGVVAAAVNVPGTISLTANAAGSATVTLSVSDGVNTPVEAAFAVTVEAVNAPPVVNAIDPQTMTVGEVRDVFYTATDTDGDVLAETVISDNGAIVAAVVSTPGTINLTANGSGTANVTLSVNDGVNPAVQVMFAVTVQAGNSDPVIQPVGPQVVDAGANLSVPVVVSDVDGDPLTLTAVSDNPGVATAVANGPAEVIVTGVVAGSANINLQADDGQGGSAVASFAVTVQGVNSPPSIQPNPIPNQTLDVNAQATIAITVTDPDGDPVVITALSQNLGVAVAEAIGMDSIVVTGVAPGDTIVDVTLDDAKGGVVVTSFNVSVLQAQPTFNLMDYPIIPSISPQMAQSLTQLYQSGVSNFGNQANAFSKVGDDPMASDNFIKPFAVPGYNLGNNGGLQGMIDAYAGTSVRAAIDPTINSFNVNSVAASNGLGIDGLSGGAPATPPCDTLGGTLLSCEFQATKPAIALISFSGANVTYMNPDQFRSELQVLVADSLSTYGVIPVLATIPAGNGFTTEQLSAYNQAIVEVASQSNVPLWNLWRAMQERSIGDPNSVAPGGAGDLTDGALGFGYNIRNLTALQTLQAVRQAVGIQ